MTADAFPRPGGIGRAFLGGLIRPSLTALLITLGVAASLLLALTRVTADEVAAVAGWFGRAPIQELDSYLVTSRALRLEASRPSVPGLVMLGGSTTRESFDEPLASALLGAAPHRAIVTDLTGSGQALLDSVALADMLPPGFRGVVVLGVNPIRVGRKTDPNTLKFPRYGVPSPSLVAEAARQGVVLPQPTGSYSVDERAFLIRMWGDMSANLHALFRSKGEPTRHWYRIKAPFKEAALRKHFALTRAALAGYDRVIAINGGVLDRLAGRMRQKGVQLVVLESPVNPRFVAEAVGSDAYGHHVAQMRAFAARANVPYLNFNRSAGLSVDDFYDWGHLRRAAATERLTRALVAAVTPELDRKERPW